MAKKLGLRHRSEVSPEQKRLTPFKPPKLLAPSDSLVFDGQTSGTTAPEGAGCASDYIAVAISACTLIFVSMGTFMIFRKRHVPEIKAKQVYLMVLQSAASIVFVVSLIMSRNIFKLSSGQVKSFFLSCRTWQIWLEGPAGFGLLMSCHLARAYRLYHVFVGRRLPPLKSFQLLPLLLFPWIAAAAVLEGIKHLVFTERCRPSSPLWVLGGAPHVIYVCLLIFGTLKIRNIRFEFNEFKELCAGSSLCVVFLVMTTVFYSWSAALKDRDESLELATRFIIVVLGDLLVIFFSWFPVARPFIAQFGVRLREKNDSMGIALGVPPSGLLVPPTRTVLSFEEPLDSLLQNKRFRLSFLAFADSRFAGEATHFYDEVRVFNRMPMSNFVGRIYMATFIIDKYIQVGSRMEINISHQMRSEILNTMDLTNPNLFRRAVNEAIKIMQQNLEKDYWESSYFRKLKEELEAEAEYSEQLERMSIRNFPLRRLSYDPLPNSDNPFDDSDAAADDEDGIWMPLDDFSDTGKYDEDGNVVQPSVYVHDPNSVSTPSAAPSGVSAQVPDFRLVDSLPHSLSVESMRNPGRADVESQQQDDSHHRPSKSI